MIHAENIQPGMEVFGTSEKQIGVVQSIEGDAIKLTDTCIIPLEWVESVGKVVRLHKSGEEVRQELVRQAGQVAEAPVRHPLAREAEHGPGTV